MKKVNELDNIFNSENLLAETNQSITDFTVLHILHYDKHFDVITSLLGCVNKKKYCEACNISYNRT